MIMNIFYCRLNRKFDNAIFLHQLLTVKSNVRIMLCDLRQTVCNNMLVANTQVRLVRECSSMWLSSFPVYDIKFVGVVSKSMPTKVDKHPIVLRCVRVLSWRCVHTYYVFSILRAHCSCFSVAIMRYQLVGVSVECPHPCKVPWHIAGWCFHLNVAKPSRPLSTNCKHWDILYTIWRASTAYCDLFLERIGIGNVCVKGGASSTTVTSALCLVGPRS